MTARQFTTLDQNACHASLVLSDGNRLVTTRSNALSFSRRVHGTIPKAVGKWGFEVYFSSIPQSSLAGMISVGIAQPNSALDKYVGEDTLSYGLLPADGVVRNNAASSVSGIPLVAERKCIGVFINMSTLRCTWYVEGNQVAYVTLPSGKFWVPAITVSGGNAGETKCEFNNGLDAFDCQPPASIT